MHAGENAGGRTLQAEASLDRILVSPSPKPSIPDEERKETTVISECSLARVQDSAGLGHFAWLVADGWWREEPMGPRRWERSGAYWLSGDLKGKKRKLVLPVGILSVLPEISWGG